MQLGTMPWESGTLCYREKCDYCIAFINFPVMEQKTHSCAILLFDNSQQHNTMRRNSVELWRQGKLQRERSFGHTKKKTRKFHCSRELNGGDIQHTHPVHRHIDTHVFYAVSSKPICCDFHFDGKLICDANFHFVSP